MKHTTTKDLTKGSPTKLVLGFMLPLLCGLLFQQIYNMVDAFIVGQVLGVDALAGVGSISSLNFLIIGTCSGLCAGFAIPIARKFGEGDIEGLKQFVGNTIWLAGTIAIALTLICTLGCNAILKILNTPQDVFDYAFNYIFIIFCGIPVTISYNALASFMQSVGDSKTPVVVLMISSLINVVLDILLVAVFPFGVCGAAIATVSSQLVSTVICLIVIKQRFDVLHPNRQSMRISSSHISALCSMGLPMALQYSITAIGSIILQSATNTLGPLSIAAITAGGKITVFIKTPYEALGSTMATFASQNAGACEYKRIKSGLRVALIFGVIYSVFAFLFLLFFGGKLAMIFTSEQSAEMESLASAFVIATGASYVLLLLVNSLRFLIQGIGFAKVAIFAGMLEMVARASTGIWIVPALGFFGACIASPLAWLLADSLLIPLYFICMKKLKRELDAKKIACANAIATDNV